MTWFRSLFVVFFVAATLLFSTSAFAQERPGGFGIGLGQGTIVNGISLKQHAGGSALQGVIGCFGYRGWNYSCGGIGLSGDYLVSMPIFFEADVVALGWNIGGGGSLGFGFGNHYYRGRYYRDGVLHAAAQFVAGLEILFPSIPLDLVLEWRPHLRIIPSPWLSPFSAGAHVRFYLN